MSDHFQTPESLDNLRNERLTVEEVREILQRLACKEFGGSELATIGSVSEASNTSTESIARILADIRQIELKELFGKRLAQHESILEEHSEKIQRIERSPTRSHNFNEEVSDELVRMAEQRIRARNSEQILATILVTISILAFVFLYFSSNVTRQSNPALEPKWTSSTTTKDGHTITTDQSGNVWVTEKSGIQRPPNKSEEHDALMLRVSAAQLQN